MFGVQYSVISYNCGAGADSSAVERLSYTQLVGGSNPSPPTKQIYK